MFEINTKFFSKLNKNNLKFDNSYIPLFSLDRECLLRELLEDFTYVALNILLAKSILDNTKLNSYLDNKELYLKELGNVYKKHFLIYKVEYDYLYKLRESKAYNYVSLEDLKKI